MPKHKISLKKGSKGETVQVIGRSYYTMVKSPVENKMKKDDKGNLIKEYKAGLIFDMDNALEEKQVVKLQNSIQEVIENCFDGVPSDVYGDYQKLLDLGKDEFKTCLKQDPDNSSLYTIQATMRESFKDIVYKPKVYDQSNELYSEIPLVGNGSITKVIINLHPFHHDPFTPGITAFFRKIQILNLKEYADESFVDDEDEGAWVEANEPDEPAQGEMPF